MRKIVIAAVAASLLAPVATPAQALTEKASAVAVLFGIMSYAQDRCSELAVDHQGLTEKLKARGLDFEDMLSDPDFKVRAVLSYKAVERDGSTACGFIRDNFGPQGVTIKGLVGPRS